MKKTKLGQTIYDFGEVTHLLNGKEITRHEYCVYEEDGSRRDIYDDEIENYELIDDPLKNIKNFNEYFEMA